MPTTPPTIAALPAPPSRDDPSTFAQRGDDFLGALPDFRAEANDLADNVYDNAVEAAASATTATTKAAEALASAVAADASADAAAASAGTAQGWSSSAEGFANSAAATLDAFDDRYLGSKAGDPSTDNDGNALQPGALYWNSTLGIMKVWTGSAWSATYLPAGAYLTLSGGTMLGSITFAAGQLFPQAVEVIATNTAAVSGKTYVLTASLTLTLPATPAAGDWVRVVNRSGATTPVVARNSEKIMALAEDLTLNDTNAKAMLVYSNATQGWVIANE